MNSAETLELIKTLHFVGASHFKSNDFEITLDKDPIKKEISFEPPSAQSDSAGAESAHNFEATEKIKELIKTMSMPPEQLMNVIFPDGAEI
jgi:hypothetical protein